MNPNQYHREYLNYDNYSSSYLMNIHKQFYLDYSQVLYVFLALNLFLT